MANERKRKEAKMRKSRLILAPAAMLAASALVLTGCAAEETADSGSSDSGSSDSADAGGDTLEVYALLPQGSDQPYGTQYVPFMQDKADELGMNLTITNSEYDADKQASECEVAVAAQPDGIILWPAVASAVRPCLEAADAAGIPVWVTNSDLLEEAQPLTAGYSGPNTYGQGVASAQLMCEEAAGAEIGIIQLNGAPGNTTAIDRDNGFTDTIAAECPNITILAEDSTDWSKAVGQQVASELITSVGIENIGGIYAADDSIVAGAIDALKAIGEDPTEYVITAIGNTFLGNPLVISGELDGTVFQSSSWDGENAAQGMYDAITGAVSGEREVRFMPDAKVTAENAEDPSVAPEW